MIKPHEIGNEENSYPSQRYLGRLFRDIKLPQVNVCSCLSLPFQTYRARIDLSFVHLQYTATGVHPTFVNFRFDDIPSYSRKGAEVLDYDEVPLRLAKRYLPDFQKYKVAFEEKAQRLADDYYQHLKFCSETFRIDDDEPLSEEECFLTMVGTPVRSVRRHEQGMRLTLFVSNFLNNLREELSKFDDDYEDLEDVQCALGLSYTLWKLSRHDFEDETFGCYSLNLIAFEAIVNNIERLDELIELSLPVEPRLLPHQIQAAAAAEAARTQLEEGRHPDAVVPEKGDDGAEIDGEEEEEYVLAEEMPGEEFE